MKKIIFLFCLFLFAIPMKVSASDMLECDGYTFEIFKDGASAVITKRGENPFMKVYTYEGHSVGIAGVTCYNDTYTFYGYATTGDSINFYDGIVFVLSQDGEVLFEKTEDYGGNEEITGAVWIDQVLFTIMRADTLGDRWNDIDPEFDFFVVSTYDSNYDSINHYQTDNFVKKYDSTDELLLLYYTHLGPVDIGLDTQLREYRDGDIFEVETIYYGDYKLPFINEGELNGQVVENGLYIDYPGNYVFEYFEQKYKFVVHPLVEGVGHMETYNHEVIPTISNGNVTLNGELYISGTPLSIPGNYSLIVDGVNGYEQTIQFTIIPTVEGVINGHAYQEPFVITFQGEGYLNNALVTSPVQIKEDGDYILRVNGVGGLSDVYEFTFLQPNTGLSVQDVIQKIDVFILVIAIIVGVVLIKKK
jgi:hypothetical protein